MQVIRQGFVRSNFNVASGYGFLNSEKGLNEVVAVSKACCGDHIEKGSVNNNQGWVYTIDTPKNTRYVCACMG